MSAEKGPGRAPGASSEASSKVKFRAPSASLDEIAQNFDYDVNPRAVSGAAKITDLLYPDLLARLLDGFFTPGGPWESLRMQLIEHGHAVAPESPKGAKRTETLMAKLLMNTTFSGCEVAIGRAVTRYLNEGIAQFRRLFAEEFDEDGTKMKASDVLRPYRRVTALSPLAVARIIIEVHHVVNIMAPGQTAERDTLSNALMNMDGAATPASTSSTSTISPHWPGHTPPTSTTAPSRKSRAACALSRLGASAPSTPTSCRWERHLRLPHEALGALLAGARHHRQSRHGHDPDAQDVAIPEPHVDGWICKDCVEGSVCGGQTWSVESWMRTLLDDPRDRRPAWGHPGHLRLLEQVGLVLLDAEQRQGHAGGDDAQPHRPALRRVPAAGEDGRISLQELAGATAILTDENDVGTYVDKAANLKAITTRDDYLMVDRKHKDPISFQFWGFDGAVPQREASRLRPLRVVLPQASIHPFEKCFTGIERRSTSRTTSSCARTSSSTSWSACSARRSGRSSTTTTRSTCPPPVRRCSTTTRRSIIR